MRKFLIISLLILSVSIPYAAAHPFTLQTNPNPSSNAAEGITKVVVYFSEPVDLNFSSLKVFDNNGDQIDNKDTKYFEDEKSLVVTTAPLDSGIYTVTSSVLSKVDGHLVPGAFNFGVGDVIVPKQQLSTSELVFLPEAGSRFPGLVGQTIVLGVVIASILIWGTQSKQLIRKELDKLEYFHHGKFGQVEAVDEVIYHKTEYRERRDHFAYFACSEPLAGFDTQRETFLGAYRGWDAPLVVASGNSCNSIAHGWQPIGSQHVKVQLKAGEQKQILFLLGYQENPQDNKFDPPGSQVINKRAARKAIEKYLQPVNTERAFYELREYWTRLLGKLQVSTPDEHTNRMVNIWNAYQCMITFNMSRSASYFESGIGRGMGVPRFEPGPAGLRAHDPGAGP